MPVALMFALRPAEPTTVPANLGRAAHAAILRLLSASNADLAARLHDDEGPKPLTVSNVLGLNARGREASVSPDQSYGLRVTLLSDEAEAVAQDWNADDLPPFDLDGMDWRVEQVLRSADEHPWVGQMSYGEIAQPALTRASGGPTRWTLEFDSPVTFRQRGMNQPLPSADLVFGSLLDKWNSYAPIALPDEVRRFASECMAVNNFELRSRGESTKNGAFQIGAVGRCTYVAVNKDRYWMACIETLAQFAFWSGVGAGAARGFGRTRLVEGRDKR